jgi:hypothetical protein
MATKKMLHTSVLYYLSVVLRVRRQAFVYNHTIRYKSYYLHGAYFKFKMPGILFVC